MGKTIKLKKGYDINIIGKPQKKVAGSYVSNTYAIKPTDFNGIAPIPKMLVEQGQRVEAGDALFYDKSNEFIKYVAPVSGTIKEIKRGPKRAIIEVIIDADANNSYRSIPDVDLNLIDREVLIKHMMEYGCWPFLTQRPFGVIADPTETPKAIFISGFDSAPLANDYNYSIVDSQEYLQMGIDALNILSGTTVHLSLSQRSQAANDLTHVKNVEKHYFDGPHPAGNVGIQIHHINPINKGEIVWTIRLMDVIALGRVLKTGQYNTERLIALGGPPVNNPQYYKAYIGAHVGGMLSDNLKDDHVRAISGNVLSGTKIDPKEGHIGFYDTQVSILEEGDKYELFGWLIPNYGRPSVSKTYLSSLFGSKKAFNVNTNTHGEKRALVVTGQYEKVLPMDLYPMQLLKSIMYGDLDQMEGLGIYEVLEEDLALCEFACTSKTAVQQVLRDGLDLMREQG